MLLLLLLLVVLSGSAGGGLQGGEEQRYWELPSAAACIPLAMPSKPEEIGTGV